MDIIMLMIMMINTFTCILTTVSKLFEIRFDSLAWYVLVWVSLFDERTSEESETHEPR